MLKVLQRVSLEFANQSQDSLNLLQGFGRREFSVRSEWAQSVQRVIDSWYYGFGSPAVAGFLESYAQDRNGNTVDTSMHHNIRAQIPDLARTIQTCPLQDVRIACQSILEDIKKKKHFTIDVPLQPSPSFCFSVEDLPHLRCLFEQPVEDDPLFTNYVLFCEYWYRWSRLDNFIQVLGCHPEFLEPFMKVHQCLLTGDLSLPYPVRYYLAILAAAELRCPQLVCLFVRYFLHAGGNAAWLQGLSEGPSRWLQLSELNHNLAHSPWKISADHIHRLTRGDEGVRGDKLSLSELMHAVAIMTHVHSLACFIFGAAVRPELEHINFTASPSPCSTQPLALAVSQGAVSASLTPTGDEQVHKERQVQASEQLLNLLQSEASGEWDNHNEDDELTEIFQSYAKSNSELTLPSVYASVDVPDGFSMSRHPVVEKFLGSPENAFVDFSGIPLLVSEFSWMEEGCPLVDHLASTLGTLLDDTFQNAFDLTYNTLNEYNDVNTSCFRHTLWFFVQSLFGVCHEDLRFDRVVKLLSIEQRSFIKSCATRPFDLVAYEPTACRTIFAALSPSEVVHILIMIMESRQQACLSYALRAISQCQTRR
ncbi:unnamed protein product [Mesocestoides corti]|uniref:Sestrin-2 n=1 Tax=Mesocestoides corti TaxID=53468 RepID=A0A158QSY7_MESCO|nr:unnamed protein product [Mesocestoides corti]